MTIRKAQAQTEASLPVHTGTMERLTQAARSDRLLLFIGAGASTCYNLPNWTELAGMLGNAAPDFRDLPGEFSRYAAIHGPTALHDFLERKLGRRPTTVMPLTRLLLAIRSVCLITTNCDRVLESAASHIGVPLRVFVDDHDLDEFHTSPFFRIVKLNGTLDRKDSLVFTTEQYAAHRETAAGLRRKVAELMRYCTVLFVGYSMADPDFAQIISYLGDTTARGSTQFVALFPRAEIDDGWRKLYLDDRIRSRAVLTEVPLEDFSDATEDSTACGPVGLLNFLSKLKGAISPDELPQLQRQSIIMMNGYTATLKSELSAYLGNCLGIPVVATHRYGRCTAHGLLDPSLRMRRYDRMLEDASLILSRGQSVILDGTFSDPAWRRRVYEMAEAGGTQLIVIKTRCDDEAYIKARLWRRMLDHSRSEHEVVDFKNFEITHHAIEQHPVEDDGSSIPLQIITFENHGDRTVSSGEGCGPDALQIAQLIRLSPLMSTHI